LQKFNQVKTMKKLIYTFFTILSLSLTITSCSNNGLCIVPEGSITTREISISDFDGIRAYGSDNITITQGEVQKVEVTGHANIIDRLETSVSNGIWGVKLENGCYKGNTSLSINIFIPKINLIAMEGSGNVIVNDLTDQEDLVYELTGSGNVEFHKNQGTEKLFIKIGGSGNVKALDDFVDLKYLEIDITGSGNYDGFPNTTDECNINIEGSGNCFVNVRNLLDVVILGSGDVNYKGNPEINASITGSGKVKNAN
jgi:hypothetical protein